MNILFKEQVSPHTVESIEMMGTEESASVAYDNLLNLKITCDSTIHIQRLLKDIVEIIDEVMGSTDSTSARITNLQRQECSGFSVRDSLSTKALNKLMRNNRDIVIPIDGALVSCSTYMSNKYLLFVPFRDICNQSC